VKVHDGTPAEWFDQFPDAPGWEHPQWCARHWAPCPVLGANGIGAATELMQIFVSEIHAPGLVGNSPQAMNAEMQAAGRLCCTLGDERMYELWAHWPPTEPPPAPA
jgi:hypothetical protein